MSGVEKQNNIRTIFQKIFKDIPENMAIAASAGISSNALVFSSMAAGHRKPNIISFTFDDFESTDFMYATKLYWCLERCLKMDPDDRYFYII